MCAGYDSEVLCLMWCDAVRTERSSTAGSEAHDPCGHVGDVNTLMTPMMTMSRNLGNTISNISSSDKLASAAFSA